MKYFLKALVFQVVFFASCIALSSQHKLCTQQLIKDWVIESGFPMNLDSFGLSYHASEYGFKEFIRYVYSGYETCGNGHDQPACKINPTTAVGASKDIPTITVQGQNLDASVDFYFQYSVQFFTSERSSFGSGHVEKDFHCCIDSREVLVKDRTNGFEQAFPTREYRCDSMKSNLRKNAKDNNQLIRMTDDEKRACEKFGRASRRWNVTEKKECHYTDNDIEDYSCKERVKIMNKRGCPASDSVAPQSWGFESKGRESVASVLDGFDRKLSLRCNPSESGLLLSVVFSQNEQSFYESLKNKAARGERIALSMKTNRSPTTELSRDLRFDDAKNEIIVPQSIAEQTLQSLRSDKTVELEISSQDSGLLKKVRFGLRGSSKALRKLTRACQ